MARPFSCLVLSPGELETSGTAIAAARAGGIGILDATRCAPEELPLLQARLGELMTLTPSDAQIGLRIGIAQLRRFKPLISGLTSRPSSILLAPTVEWPACPPSPRHHDGGPSVGECRSPPVGGPLPSDRAL